VKISVFLTPKKAKETAMSDSSEFHVKLDGIKLPSEVEKRIASEIQATVFRELAKTNLATESYAILLPGPSWRGMWIRPPEKADKVAPVFTAVQTDAG
jgi:hypothetical protein